jgi:hypothetical protein
MAGSLPFQLQLLVDFADERIVLWVRKEMDGKHVIRPMIHPEMLDGADLGIRMAQIKLSNRCEFSSVIII